MGRYIVDRTKDGEWSVHDRKLGKEIAWFVDDRDATLFVETLNKKELDNVR